jgi:hypothetical protein
LTRKGVGIVDHRKFHRRPLLKGSGPGHNRRSYSGLLLHGVIRQGALGQRRRPGQAPMTSNVFWAKK